MDLIIHDQTEFVKPLELTTNEQTSIAQAYIALFLTKLGSIGIKPAVGIDFEVGTTSIPAFMLLAQKLNKDILKLMKIPYNISNIKVTSIEQVDDQVIMKVNIDNEINVAVEV